MIENHLESGEKIYNLLCELFPLCRSITGDGVRETLKILQNHIPLKIYEVPTGTEVFDWTVPKEWNIRDGFIKNSIGEKIVDFKENNLHVVGYSLPVNKEIDFEELDNHLYSLPDNPDAIPYVTSYYKERWGFCISHNNREKLNEGKYQVCIDSELKNGALTYGELIIPGKTDKEIFLSTYVCHPSMANNELSGPVLTAFLAKWIAEKPRYYTYRIIFIPEIIGSLCYLSKNMENMKKNIVAGFNLTCVGDNRVFSFLPSRNGHTLADKVAENILRLRHPNYIKYSYLDRGSDERNYCSPQIDLPIVSIMRSKYGTYAEYHTSKDNLDFVCAKGLQASYNVYCDCIELLENNRIYKVNCIGEPQLSKYNLYPTISIKKSDNDVRNLLHFIAFADGKNDVIDISNMIGLPLYKVYQYIEQLKQVGLLEEIDETS